MKDHIEYLLLLIKKSRSGRLSEEEAGLLGRMLDSDLLQQIRNESIDEEYIRARLREYFNYSHREAFRDFRKRAARLSPRRRIAMAGGIAAAVLLLAGLFIVWRNAAGGESAGGEVNSGIMAGTNRAVLRLADGQELSLSGDSVICSHDMGVEINYSHGTLSYTHETGSGEAAFNELRIPRGGESHVVLGDGTKIWVNAETSLKYPVAFTGGERRVYLDGEAFFEVAGSSKPFIVSTYLGDVTVLGTSFDVKAYRDEGRVLTTLVSGRVRFDGQQRIDLAPGEQAVVLTSGDTGKRVVDVREYVGWKEGLFTFRDRTLGEIMDELARWYDITVRYEDPGIRDIEFTGELRRYDYINQFMDKLALTDMIKYRIEGRRITIYK